MDVKRRGEINKGGARHPGTLAGIGLVHEE